MVAVTNSVDIIKHPEKLAKIVREFIDELNLTCDEDIHGTDRVIDHANDFVEELCDLVGYAEPEVDEDEDITDGDYDPDNPMYSSGEY